MIYFNFQLPMTILTSGSLYHQEIEDRDLMSTAETQGRSSKPLVIPTKQEIIQINNK